MNRNMLTSLILMLSIALLAMGQTAPPDTVRALLDQAEKAHDANDYQKTMTLLQQAEKFAPNSAEVLWKEARGYFDFADQKPDDVEWRKQNLYPGLKKAEQALKLDDNSAGAHKWYAIMIGQVGEIEGTKQKILNSYPMKEHTLRAIELDPTEAANYHVMGRWHYALADLSWVERQVASIIYATPPDASFEEALKYFQKANQLDQDDLRNVLYMGKCYEALDQDDKAGIYFKKTIAMKAVTDSDRAIQKEAQEGLDDL
ncbi:MAG TPA: hypothetical protein DHU63_06795 [Candidatus Marinimicrobia bacterium]|nr:MAG: hypothetical protein AUJ47_03290 [Candidatus Marinimicrobia bacterium CG1_02_48_14]PIZ69437.1 MAG: hypothetical protein COY19_01880 [Candidatus Marinimicrobia bacterium CG_4_10_14_0_2_um_filter_48_9]HCW76231.1 hypothetical protein [Candidatus Neomarinimicrobiota bacterium]